MVNKRNFTPCKHDKGISLTGCQNNQDCSTCTSPKAIEKRLLDQNVALISLLQGAVPYIEKANKFNKPPLVRQDRFEKDLLEVMEYFHDEVGKKPSPIEVLEEIQNRFNSVDAIDKASGTYYQEYADKGLKIHSLYSRMKNVTKKHPELFPRWEKNRK